MNCTIYKLNHLYVHKHTHSHLFSYNLFSLLFFLLFFFFCFFSLICSISNSRSEFDIQLPYCHTSMQCFFLSFFSLPHPFPYFLFFFSYCFSYKRKTSSSRKVTFKILNEYPLFTSKIINVSLNPCRNVHSCIIITRYCS